MARELTPKQRMFCDEYLIDLNATQAAIRAGYSNKTANEQGARLLANVSIRAYIDQKMAERSRRCGITADRVLNELAKIGFCNAADLINFNKATVMDGADSYDTAAIQSVKVKTMSTDNGDMVEREVKLYDKTKSLELIGKHLGMFKEKVEATIQETPKSEMAELINQRRERMNNASE